MKIEDIEMYYNLLSILSVSNKSLENNNNYQIDKIRITNNFIYKELLRFGINNIGLPDE